MIFYYLDASAWVKRYYQETGTRWVQRLFANGETLTCASLGVVEVTATLARKAKAREISRKQMTQKVRELDEDWSRFIQIHLSVDCPRSYDARASTTLTICRSAQMPSFPTT